MKCVVCEQHHSPWSKFHKGGKLSRIMLNAVIQKSRRLLPGCMTERRKKKKRSRSELKRKATSSRYVFGLGLFVCHFSSLHSLQKMEQSKLDWFVRTVAKDNARPLPPGETMAKWKFEAPQALALNRAVGDCVIRSGQHHSAIDGDGFDDILKLAEPRLCKTLCTIFQECIFSLLVYAYWTFSVILCGFSPCFLIFMTK